LEEIRMKKNSSTLIGLVVVIVVIVGGYLIYHNSHKSTSNSGYNSPTTSNNSKSSSGGAIIQTKTASNVGSYLADSNGNALYTYGSDTNGVSNCNSSCTSSWPIYQASSSSATLPANVTVITRSDGTKQYAYKGKPLYTFSGDSSGQVTGDGTSNFSVAKP
jgi:predicted lipoprotein with Yx(FWY)xxD motif